MMRLWCVAAVIFGAGCAPPVRSLDERFVSSREMAAVALTREGLGLLGRGQAIDGELKFRLALRLYPDAANLKRNLAAALIQTEQYEEAESIYRELLTADSPDALALEVGLAKAAALDGRSIEALSLYEKAYERASAGRDPALQASIALSLSSLNFALGREETAVCYAAAAYAAKPDGDSANRYGGVLVAVNQPEKASAVVGRMVAAQRESPDPRLLHLQALSAFELGQMQSSFEAETRALESGQSIDQHLRDEILLVRRLSQGEADRVEASLGDPETDRLLFLPPRLLRSVKNAG